MDIDLSVGTLLNINDECLGEITNEDGERIYIESDCFTGWATKKEIRDAIRALARERTTDQQHHQEKWGPWRASKGPLYPHRSNGGTPDG